MEAGAADLLTRHARPARVAGALAAWLALAVAGSVYRIPIQVSDSAEILESVDRTPSVGAAFAQGLRASTTMLRPMRQAGTRVLLDVAHAVGNRYNAVFRGFHAGLAGLLIVLFAWVARPRTWADVAALSLALLVLTGLHTFGGMVREAYPINHFLLVALYAVGGFALAQSDGGWGIDLGACVLFALAALTLESGLVVLPVACAAYAGGLRGVSRRAIGAMVVLAAAYVLLRVGVLHMVGNGVGERQTGFGTDMLSTADLRAMFGRAPWLLYAYTIVSSALTVPFSQPVSGQWTALAALKSGGFQLFYLNDICTSLVATATTAWYMLTRPAPDRPRRWRRPLPLAFLAVLGTSAVLSYAYAKNEIMSTAGVFYALVVFEAVGAAVRAAAGSTAARLRAPVLVCVLCVSAAWAFRAVGLQYRLQRGAFEARTEWVIRMPPYHEPPVPDADARLTPALRREALGRGRTNPYLLWPRFAGLWGEN